LEGYTVQTASDGQEALELFKSNKFDLAFLDIKMPLLSGTEVLKKIRQQGITLPVIIITAYATIKNAVDCTHMGAVAYIQKPFTADKVRSVLNELCIMPSNGVQDSMGKNQVKQIENYLKQGKFLEAIELLKIAISEEPINAYIYLLFSKAYQGVGNIEYAEKFSNIYGVLKE
jgi:DNA-binding NtrC family response regulator